ncbi:MAG: type II and III secretion system protein [Gemmataceae bacterium]|nr:type II and III secretion system protein [Gemmataceae bacterium]MDW8263811.1 hypothetical protein [Gemmataceae bacterium]
MIRRLLVIGCLFLCLGLHPLAAPARSPEATVSDRTALRRVLLEVHLLSVSAELAESLTETFGIPCKEVVEPGQPCQAAPLTILTRKEFAALLDQLRRDSRSALTQTPRLTAEDGKPVEFQLVDRVKFTTGLEIRAVGTGIAYLPKEEIFPVGIDLSLRPTVAADRQTVQIRLRGTFSQLAPGDVPQVGVTTAITSVDDLRPRKVAGHVIEQPLFTTLTLDTTLEVRDGQTAVLGGYLMDREVCHTIGVPLLSSLPWVGHWFTTEYCDVETHCVLLTVTPRIVEGPASPAVPHRAIRVLDAASPSPSASSSAVVPAQFGPVDERPQQVRSLLRQYHEACREGRLDDARRLALEAIRLDPTCFSRRKR